MQNYSAFFKGKNITLLGLGLLGRGIGDARFLAECGARVTVTDLKDEEALKGSLKELEGLPLTYHLGGHTLEDFKNCDLVVKAAGVPLDSPFVAEAKKNGIPVRMSADLFAELAGVPVVGVTGTRGKSTVAHMVAHILKAAGKKVLLGGNVRGVSTLALLKDVTPDAIAVLELDSWQLQGFGEAKMSPHVAVFTTFMPDHMNYYKDDIGSYFADKAKIFLNQAPEDTLVLGEQVAPFIKEYGYGNKVPSHVVVAGSKNFPTQWTLLLRGEHNRYNAGLAIAAADALGVETDVMCAALETFKAVEGRLEFVAEKNGIKIYNDNNATTPEATLAALKAFEPGKTVLIAGGADKGLDMSALVTEMKKSKKVLLLDGTGTSRIQNSLENTTIYRSIAEAVQEAFAAASAGDVILFSPAFASFGLFKNEYDRNDQFLKAVSELAYP